MSTNDPMLSKFSKVTAICAAIAATPVYAAPLLKPQSYKVNTGATLSSSAAEHQMAITHDHAARLAKKQIGGKVLNIRPTKVKGERGYKVKLLKKDGHVVSVFVNGKSGKVNKGKP